MSGCIHGTPRAGCVAGPQGCGCGDVRDCRRTTRVPTHLRVEGCLHAYPGPRCPREGCGLSECRYWPLHRAVPPLVRLTTEGTTP